MARAQLQVMGLERGAADVQLPSLLWGWPVLCPLAHAEVLAIDAHEAQKDKRVLAVLTAQTSLHEPATRHQALLSSLLSPSVHQAGRVVALVLAETRQLASEAAAKVLVRVRAHSAQLNVTTALASGATLPSLMQKSGQAAEAYLGAPTQLKQSYRTAARQLGSTAHGVATAVWRGDALTLYTVGHPPPELATLLGLPSEQLLTVVSPLGAKVSAMGPQALLAAIAAAHLGRPVRIELPALSACGVVAETVQTVQLGVGESELPQALLLHGAVGSSADGSGPALAALMDLMTVYGFAHRELNVVPVPLHLPSQQRPGEPSGWHELGLSVELLIDELAQQRAVDPLLLRQRWLEQTATADGSTLLGCLQLLHKVSGDAKQPARSSEGLLPRRGCGVASSAHRATTGQTLYGAHFVEVELSSEGVTLLRHHCVLAAGQPDRTRDADSVVQRSLEKARRLALQAELQVMSRAGWTARHGEDCSRLLSVRHSEVTFLALPSREPLVASEDDLAMLAQSGVAAAMMSALSVALGIRLRRLPIELRAFPSVPK